MFNSVDDVKQIIVLLVLAISLFTLLIIGQIDLAEKIIIALIAITANNQIVKK